MNIPIKNIITLIILCNVTDLLPNQAPCEVYIENYYGSPIICTTNLKKFTIQSNSEPVQLSFYGKKLTSLSIETTAYLASSTRLESYLQQIAQESAQNRNKKAVLIIKPSGYVSDWDIRLAWYPQHTFLTKFSMETPEDEAETQERQFQTKKISTKEFLLLIKNNLYGTEYAEKLKTLSEINYDSAQRNKSKKLEDLSTYGLLHSFGYPVLIVSIGSIQENYMRYTSNPDAAYTQSGNRDPHEVQTLVQELIEKEYDKFLLYKQNGWLEVTE